MASLLLERLPVALSSTKTSMNTSMELVKARLTLASMVTVSPSRMGWSKETLLTAAVTTTRRQWRLALMAEAMSIQLSN